MCEPLQGKEEQSYEHKRNSVRGKLVTIFQDEPRVRMSVLESAVKGLIKYHENNIEGLIMIVKEVNGKETQEDYLFDIRREYTDINAVELWLEDVVKMKKNREV